MSSSLSQSSFYIKRMNLTAVKDADEVMERHVEDSLAILLPLRDCYRTRYGDTPSHEKLSLVDIGTGAGLPRVVLAIACPEWEVTLIESMNKRCVFLEHVVGIIGSSNIQIVRGRTEVEKKIDLVYDRRRLCLITLLPTQSATKKIEILQKKLNEAQMTIQMKRKEAKDQIERHTKAEWAICLCNSRMDGTRKIDILSIKSCFSYC
ncbi:uncharacterized protein [Arachis hypogaea]|uniref:uncharacterized protein isoform X2 n=1 Tax=Arachis hypogaea TaxID=3818 RepID=UPI003B21F16B